MWKTKILIVYYLLLLQTATKGANTHETGDGVNSGCYGLNGDRIRILTIGAKVKSWKLFKGYGCTDGSPASGTTSKTFNPAVTGVYAVRLECKP
jgi:hypothetical protein